jgi:hypothetical protein
MKKLLTIGILLASLTNCVGSVPPAPFYVNTGCKVPFHYYLGATIGFPGCTSHYVFTDAQVSELRVRHVRTASEVCEDGYIDHLELLGPIGPDSTAAIARIIPNMRTCINDKGSKVSLTIYMSSGGGLLEDGFELGRILRENEMTTKIVNGQSCASSCAIAFLGGLYRHMDGDGQIFFHAPYREGRYSIDCSDRGQVRALRNYYEDQLGDADGEFLLSRTMDYCSTTNGWKLNADAAKVFNITTY